MQQIFTKHVFDEYKENHVIKPQMDGFNDPTLHDFLPLSFSSVIKVEYIEEWFEKEFIESFRNAAKVLADAGQQAVNVANGYPFPKFSYALPMLYMTRHCMELALKRAIRKFGGTPGTTHNLTKLWSSFQSRLPSRNNRICEDRRTIKNMGLFVKEVSTIDDTGFDLRYSKDNVGEYTQGKWIWVNAKEVPNYLDQFVEQLESINTNI